MIVILMGAPGSGKGTQAKLLNSKFEIPHISTGDIFRENIKDNTKLGNKAKEYIDSGKLVPDKLTGELIFKRLKKPDCEDGYILDGFPRTVNQGKLFDEFKNNEDFNIDAVINISVPDETVIKRLTGRRMCQNCMKTYHIDYDRPKTKGMCDDCGGKLIQREDDSPKTIKERLRTYHKQSEPLIEYYKNKGILTDVDGCNDVDVVFKAILKAINV